MRQGCTHRLRVYNPTRFYREFIHKLLLPQGWLSFLQVVSPPISASNFRLHTALRLSEVEVAGISIFTTLFSADNSFTVRVRLRQSSCLPINQIVL
jgi:hypothetical protein